MSEYFIIVNTDLEQIINPASMYEPSNLESVVAGIPSNLLAYLLTEKSSREIRFKDKRNDYKGSWLIGEIGIFGDQDQTEERQFATMEYDDITLAVLEEYRHSGIEHEPQKLQKIDQILKMTGK